ncbi:MAG: PLP-dependent aminotransferase family protein [Actinomycetes bacterium]
MADTSLAGRRVARLLGPSWRTTAPAYRSLADALRLLVLDGRMPPGTRLPGERELAHALGLSRTTVASAYDLLRERGFLVSRQGSGTTASLPARNGEQSRSGVLGGLLPSTHRDDDVLDLACAALEAPAGIGRAVQGAVEALPDHLCSHGYEIQGVHALREAIARRYRERGLPTTAEQIIVTGGALAALGLALRALVGPGDRVVVDHPTYPNALDALRRAGARLVPVAMGDDGWDIAATDAAMRQSAAGVAYVVADFANPTGHLMSDAERRALAAAAARARTTLLVDETLVDLSLDLPESAMPAPLALYAERAGGPDAAVTIGSASKSFWGGLGIGWLRASESMVDRLVATRASLDLGTAVIEQLVVAQLLADRDVLLPARRAAVRARRDALADALRHRLPDWRFRVPEGGLALWCELPQPLSTALAAGAAAAGVRLSSGARFGVDGAFERYVRLPYTLAEPDLRAAIDRVAATYTGLLGGAPALGLTGRRTITA